MTPPASLQSFQRHFGRYVRDPDGASFPAGIPVRRARIYEELLFNNLRGFLNACFPVCRRMLGGEAWERLMRDFFRDWRCETPFFSEIPEEFVSYLMSDEVWEALPDWFTALAHYEWIELSVDLTDEALFPSADSIGDLNTLRVNPTLRNLVYQWPVHTISETHRPSQPALTYLLVYRDSAFAVQFAEINAMTSRLIEQIKQRPDNAENTLLVLAEENQAAPSAQWMTFGKAMIDELLVQEIILTGTPCAN